MKKMKLKGLFLVVGLAMIFAMTPFAQAGEGGPPEGFRYDPPPYSGEVVLSYDGVYVTVNGTVDQFGNSGCVGTFSNYSMPYTYFGSEKLFQDLNSGDLQGVVFPNTGFGIFFPCLGEGAPLQVLGVGKMNWEGPSEFSASFVIMGLQ